MKMTHDPHAICRKWVARLGLGFHPDTRGEDYLDDNGEHALPDAEVIEYNRDMNTLFKVAADPYECGVMAMQDADLC